MGKLTRHSFHAKSAAAWHQGHGVRRIDVFQDARDVLHHALKALGHVVQCAVCVNHRKFEQAIGVNVGQQSGHGHFSSGEISRATNILATML